MALGRLHRIWPLNLLYSTKSLYAEFTSSEILTHDEHDRRYKTACNLIQPYFHLHGVKSRPVLSLKDSGKLRTGIRILERVIEYRPSNWAAHWIIGKAHQALAEPDLACEAFKRAFEIERRNPDVAREYALECLHLGRFEDAIAANQQAIQSSPADAGLLANLALAYLLAGKLKMAQVAVKQSLVMAPKDSITIYVDRIISEVQAGKRSQPKSVADIEAG